METYSFVIQLPLKEKSTRHSTLRYRKENGWVTRNFYHHCIEYQKDDGYYEYVTIFDERGVDTQLYQVCLVAFDISLERPVAVVALRGSISFDNLKSYQQNILDVSKEYPTYLFK